MIEHQRGSLYGSFDVLRIDKSHVVFQFDREMNGWNLEEPVYLRVDHGEVLIREFVKEVGGGQKVIYGRVTEDEILTEIERRGWFRFVPIVYDGPSWMGVIKPMVFRFKAEDLPRFEIAAVLEKCGVKVDEMLLRRINRNPPWDAESPGVEVYLIGHT